MHGFQVAAQLRPASLGNVRFRPPRGKGAMRVRQRERGPGRQRFLRRGVRGLALLLVLAAAFACLGTAAGAGSSARGQGGSIVGVADDAPKYADDGGAAIYAQLRELGMREVRVVVDFDPSQPKRIQEKAFLDRSVSKAVAAGIDVVFSVYPHVPRAFAADTDARVAAFGAYLALLARTYPEVKKFIVLNEPNEGFFFAPQFGGRRNVSAGIAFKALAAGYDRLKAVNRMITVVGLGLSPDGNGITSTPPVRFIKALGDAYRASGRSRPIMDELAFHIHPRDSRTFDEKTHFKWPNAGPADLNRIKQAIWDAFHGTAQPVFSEAGGARVSSPAQPQPLRFKLAEVAVQVRIAESLASAVHELGGRPRRRRGEAGEGVRLAAALLRVRPGRRRGPVLPADRSAGPPALPERSPPHRRLGAALVRLGARRDRGAGGLSASAELAAHRARGQGARDVRQEDGVPGPAEGSRPERDDGRGRDREGRPVPGGGPERSHHQEGLRRCARQGTRRRRARAEGRGTRQSSIPAAARGSRQPDARLLQVRRTSARDHEPGALQPVRRPSDHGRERLLGVVPEHVGSSGPPWRLKGYQALRPKEDPEATQLVLETLFDVRAAVYGDPRCDPRRERR